MRAWTRHLPAALCLAACIAFAACGGDEGGGDGGGGGPGTNLTGVTGFAFKGRFSAGTVTARQLNSNGTLGAAVGTGSVDSSGHYTIATSGFTGPVHITLTGGTYADEVTGTGTAQTAPLTAVIPSLLGTPQCNITPLTTMAAEIATQRMAGGGAVGLSITRANTQIGNYFGIANILTTIPDDLSAGTVVGGTTAANLGALLAAISQSANTLGVNPTDLVEALARDLQDGVFDGQDSVGAIALGAGNLSSTAAQGDLAAALTTFLGSPANQSGLVAADFAALINRLQTNVDNTLFVMSIVVTPGTQTVAMDMQVQYQAMGTLSDGTQADITASATWDSSDTAVATISAAGLATAQTTAGTSSITADQDNASGSATLTVGNFTLTSITVTPASPQLARGSTQQFTATANYSGAGGTADITSLVTWDSATPAVLGMNATGLGSALTTGTSVVSATEPGTAVAGNTTASVIYSYALDVQPIFNNNCINCHPPERSLNLSSYANLMAGGQSGAVVVPGNSAGSIIVQRLEGTIMPQMPYLLPPLPPATIQIIKDWIDDGALNN